MVKETVFLRKIRVEDADLIVKWFNDPIISKYMDKEEKCTKKEIIKYYTIKKSGDIELIIVENATKRPIGYCSIYDINKLNKNAEISFLIGEKSAQGKGYGKEALKQLLEEAFKKLKLHSLFATATVENIPSIKTLEKGGFKKIGIRREYNLIGKKYLDEILFDITIGDYKELKKNKSKNN